MKSITKSLIWTGRVFFALLLLGEGFWIVNEIPHWFGELSIYDKIVLSPYDASLYDIIISSNSANLYCAIALLLITAFMVWSAIALLPK